MSLSKRSNVSQDVGRKRKAAIDDNGDDVRILVPKQKPPLQLVSYPHVDTLHGVVEKTRQFCSYFNRVLGQFSGEIYQYHIKPEARVSVPNYLEKCSTLVGCEMSSMRGLMNGVAARMEKMENLLMKMPFPPRDVCRKNHLLNGFTPESIAKALFEFSKVHPIPPGMEFDQEKMEALKREAMHVENHGEILVDEASQDAVVEPLEDYSRENEELEIRQKDRVEEDKRLNGKKILPAKEGVIKMTYTNYHTKVMKMLTDKDMFGVEYKPYKKQYLKVIYNRIENEQGIGILNKMIEFFQLSYKAYEAIFVEGGRSVFGPADVKSDVQQHLAQVCHYFNANVSSTPLL